LGIKVDAGKEGQLGPDFRAEPTDGRGRFESPVVATSVGKMTDIIRASWCIDSHANVILQVVDIRPSQHEWIEGDIADAVGSVAHIVYGRPGFYLRLHFHPDVRDGYRAGVIAAYQFQRSLVDAKK